MILLGVVIWLVRLFYAQAPAEVNALEAVPTVNVAGIENAAASVDTFAGIPRLAQAHTIIPSRPRLEIVKYTVLEGDTVFGIAEKFGLAPETILWGNYYILLDDPHGLKPGQELNILSVN